MKQAEKRQFAFMSENYPKMNSEPDMFQTVMDLVKTQRPDKGVDQEDCRRQTIATLAATAGYENPEQIAKEVLDVFLEERNKIHLYEGVPQMLQSLKDKGIKLGSITNGTADTNKTVLKDLIPFCIQAGKLGKPKPDPTSFREALSLTGTDPSVTVHVGDNLLNDVLAPQKLGMRVVWFNSSKEKRPDSHKDAEIDSEVHTIAELAQVLESWC